MLGTYTEGDAATMNITPMAHAGVVRVPVGAAMAVTAGPGWRHRCHGAPRLMYTGQMAAYTTSQAARCYVAALRQYQPFIAECVSRHNVKMGIQYVMSRRP